VVQKRLDLQKECIALEQEMLEAEKINFKKTVKLASKSKNIGTVRATRTMIADTNGTERDRMQYLELKDEIEKLRERLKAYQKKEENRERRQKVEATNFTAGIAVVDSSGEQNIKILELEKELREVKREHITSTKKHTLDKKKWENGTLELAKNKSIRYIAATGDTVDCSTPDEVKRLGLLVENYEAESKGLMEENERLKRSSRSLLKFISVDGAKHELGDTYVVGKVAEKFNVLREEWRREKEILEIQLRDQSRQMDDWKLLLPRNKVLLEQTISKNKHLVKELEDARSRSQEQADSKIESKQQLKTQQQMEQQHDKNEEMSLDEMNTMSLEYDHIDRRGSSTMNISSSNFVSTILIPLDLSSEDMKKLKKKFVIEWEWANGEIELGGLYTGWLDLEGNPSGNGSLRIDDGGIYIGEWKQGLRNGNGVYTSIDGALYSGPWLNDRFQGRGVFVSETNQVYTGDWNNGLRHGSGIETWAHGAFYTGHYYLDKRNGNCDYRSTEERSFDDIDKDQQPDGNGKKKPSYGPVLQDSQWVMGNFLGS